VCLIGTTDDQSITSKNHYYSSHNGYITEMARVHQTGLNYVLSKCCTNRKRRNCVTVSNNHWWLLILDL
jgi:hypothetical protein